MESIVFQDREHGFVLVAYEGVFETKDGGTSWQIFHRGVRGLRGSRSFASVDKGWSIENELNSSRSIYATTNGGRSWKIVYVAPDRRQFLFGAMEAVSESEAWAVGTQTLHTTDGGRTWKESGPGATNVQFLDAKRGWLLGDHLWKTADGGLTWAPVGPSPPQFGGLGLYFLDESRGWAAGGSSAYASSDSANDNRLTGRVSKTQDGGKTETEVARIPGHFFWSIFFLDDRIGWVGGIRGDILKTDDGGATWHDTRTGQLVPSS